MKKLLLPLILLVLGIGGGVGAGIVLAPSPDDGDEQAEGEPTETEGAEENEAEAAPSESEGQGDSAEDGAAAVEYLDMSNQFIIPLVQDGNVNGIVVISISLEVIEGTIAAVNALEPKIRDRFLQVLFNHANNGGFDGNFTDFRYLSSLKQELLRNAKIVTGQDVVDVLILDLVRQQQ